MSCCTLFAGAASALATTDAGGAAGGTVCLGPRNDCRRSRWARISSSVSPTSRSAGTSVPSTIFLARLSRSRCFVFAARAASAFSARSCQVCSSRSFCASSSSYLRALSAFAFRPFSFSRDSDFHLSRSAMRSSTLSVGSLSVVSTSAVGSSCWSTVSAAAVSSGMLLLTFRRMVRRCGAQNPPHWCAREALGGFEVLVPPCEDGGADLSVVADQEKFLVVVGGAIVGAGKFPHLLVCVLE